MIWTTKEVRIVSKKSKRNSNDLKMEKKLGERFQQEFGERFGDEEITQMNIADADLDYSQLFGANKNLYRTIPSLIDGLKPGKRRLLYSWFEFENNPTSLKKERLKKLKYVKVDRLAAGAQKYHPHGGSATEELIGKEGQYWNNNVMLVDPQGSYGNQRGDKPGAGRYIEARLSEYTIDCFFDDFFDYCVPMKLAYDGDSYEPEYLPAKYPHVLFNPQFSSIGYGLASNIPPFNVTEVLDATIKLMKDPNAKILLIPDSPTGCDVVDTGMFDEINKSGKAKVTFRATSEIDYTKNVIHISSLPLLSTSDGVIQKISALKSKGVFDEIIEIKDNTIEGEVNFDIYLSNDAKPDKVLKKLYKKSTDLKSSFAVGITVIDDYQEFEYGVRELLLEWINSRTDDVRSMFLNKYQNLLSTQHMNEVLLMVFDADNIDKAIEISRSSKGRKDAIERYMKEFNLTSLQASTLADMRIYNFSEDWYEMYKKESVELREEIDKVNDILSDDSKINEFIINQLEGGKKKWGRPRKSKIVKEDDKSNDNIPDTEHLIGVSETGYVKKLMLKDNSSIGSVGKSSSNITVIQANNRENLLLIDSVGDVVKISISAIPDMVFTDIGVELNKFFSVKGSIKAVMELPTMDVLKVKDENLGIIFITKKGLAKKVQISEFKKITDVKSGIILNDNDEVAAALFAFNNSAKDIIISTNMGDGIRLPLSEIRNSGVTAKGVSMLTLKDGEEVVGASMVNPKKKYLFFMTSAGRTKITEVKYFPTMKRKGDVLSLISLSGNETLLGVSSVDKNDVVEVYHKNGEPERIEIKNMEVSTRISKGEKLIKTGRGDYVVAYKVFSSK